MADRARRVGILAPMPNELRPLVRRLGLRRAGTVDGRPAHAGYAAGLEVLATGTGIGTDRAAAASEALLATGPLAAVVVCGIAGGVPGRAAVGDVVIPTEVLDRRSGERFAAHPPPGVVAAGTVGTGDEHDYQLDAAAIAALAEDGVDALDMETAAIARVCDAAGVPWLAVRAVSDPVGDPTVGPVVMTLVDGEGRPRVGRAARFLLTHPGRIPRIVRLACDTDRAARRAAAATARVLEALGGAEG